MEGGQVIEIAEMAVFTMLKMSLPLMLTALAVGLVISLFQALTQIQENTLSFIPKIIVMTLVMLALLPMAGHEIERFTAHVFTLIATPEETG
ncbi:MAG: flagellar biosynthetic protein FliQ [Rickettsiales bacterium]